MKRVWLLSILLPAVGWSFGVAATTTTELVTPAEASDFRATPGYAETLAFVRRLTEMSPSFRLEFFGESAEGRPLPLVVVSGKQAFSPETAAAADQPIVLIQNGIHAGEIDGKDACLMILRDLALGSDPELLERLILLVIPIYNVDGHERVSRHNRPNQNGPVEGMGFRTTADGHDLNRDHLKLETPEARAMIGLFNAWRPHLHVDNHVTDGSDHDWVLTYAWAEAPQLAPSIDAWLASRMPRVRRATAGLGHRIGPFVGLLDRSDPAAGFSSVVGEPRFATGYYPLRNRSSILVENHSYKPYRARVLANRDFLLSLLREIAREPDSLIESVRRAERRTVALGRPDASPTDVVLRYRHADPQTTRFPVYDWYSEPSVVTGAPLLRYRRGELREIEVPWVHRVNPDHVVARPRGYLVLPGWPVIERRLADHALEARRLDDALEIEVETLRISRADASRAGSYQGLTREDVTVERRAEVRRLPAGTLWIPADQPDFEVAVQLLEPDAPDSLVSWGLLSLVMERKEYIDPRVLENLARTMLDDPAVAAAWERALQDEAFAANRRARHLWWYRRTDHWDETVGLMPVMRLLTEPDLPIAPPAGGPIAKRMKGGLRR
jgi:hypothetical protein